MLLLLWGIGFFGMKSSLAPIPFICKHLVPIYKLVWDTVFLYGTRNIYVFWNLLLFQKICNTVVTCATHRAVPVGLSCFHIEGNLLSRKAIWELFGNAFKIDFYIYIYIRIMILLDLKSQSWNYWEWTHTWSLDLNDLEHQGVWVQACALQPGAHGAEFTFSCVFKNVVRSNNSKAVDSSHLSQILSCSTWI